MGFGNGAFQAARIAIDGVTIIENIETGKIQAGPNVGVNIAAINESTLSIPIINNQPVATPAPFQQMIQLNLSQYPLEGIASDLSNIYFSSDEAGQNKLYSWRETSASLTSTQTWWVLLSNGIPANGTTIIFLQVSNEPALDGIYTGEAPQLSSTYGQYDNGAKVFNNYWNFAGTSLPKGLASLGAGIVSVNNGVTLETNGNDVLIYSTDAISYPQIVDVLIQTSVSSKYPTVVIGEATTTSLLNGVSTWLENGYSWDYYNGNWRLEYVTSSGRNVVNQVSANVVSGDIYSMAWVAVGNEQAYINYVNEIEGVDKDISSIGNYYIWLGIDSAGNVNTSFTAQWLRTRAYPPNGIMPSPQAQTVEATKTILTSNPNKWTAIQTFSAGLVDVNPTYVYVANYGSKNVSVIDTSTNAVITTISVGSSPYGVAITPNGLYSYVTNLGSNNVSVINTSTNTVVSTIGSLVSPISVAITPNGLYAYVVNRGNGTVSVINTSTNTVVATISVGSEPGNVAITPNGLYAYVTNGMSNNVSVINTSTNTVVATISVGTSPTGVAITPNGLYAYVANEGSNNVSVINTSTNTVVATIPVGGSPIGVVITPNGLYAYVANGMSNNVSVINTSTNTVVATISVGGSPSAIAVAPYFYTATQIAPYLSGFQQNTSTPQTTLAGSTAGSITYSMPTAEGTYKKFVAYASGYENDTTTAQTISFPVAFVNTPYVATAPSGLISSTTTTGITLASGTTTTYTGWIIIEGY